MRKSEPPASAAQIPNARATRDSEAPDLGDEPSRLERALPDLIRRVVEAGLERLSEGPENVRQRIGEMKLPKEALASVLSQIDEGKAGLYRALAKELRDFLEGTNFTDELVRALTTLSFEIKTEVRLIPNDSGRPRPHVKSNVRVRQSADSKSSPPEEDEENS